jgi:hypothetical protein
VHASIKEDEKNPKMFRPYIEIFGANMLVLVLRFLWFRPAQHDGVLRAQVVRGQAVRLPLQPLVRVRQELGPGQLGAVSDVGHVKVVLPRSEQVLPVGQCFDFKIFSPEKMEYLK